MELNTTKADGCISVFFAVCVIGNFIDAISFFQSNEEQMKLQNSALPDKQKYISAVDRQTNWLKETVKLAEEYAQKRKLYFGLKV